MTTLPVALRDLRTSATDPSVSWPASSMNTQSTSNERCLLKLYNCRVGRVNIYNDSNQHDQTNLINCASIDICLLTVNGRWGMVITLDDVFDLDAVQPGYR